MAFVLSKKTESFFYPVNVPEVLENGTTQINRFDFRFKRLPRSYLNQLQEELERAKDAEADLEVNVGAAALQRDIDYIMEIADGWKGVDLTPGVPADFSRETLTAMVDNHPNAAGAIVQAFFEATLSGGRKAKNLGTPRGTG